MKVQLNNEEIEIQSDKLSDLLQSKSLIERKGIAVAVNDSIVSKTNWSTTCLKENDKLLIITATQGG